MEYFPSLSLGLDEEEEDMFDDEEMESVASVEKADVDMGDARKMQSVKCTAVRLPPLKPVPLNASMSFDDSGSSCSGMSSPTDKPLEEQWNPRIVTEVERKFLANCGKLKLRYNAASSQFRTGTQLNLGPFYAHTVGKDMELKDSKVRICLGLR